MGIQQGLPTSDRLRVDQYLNGIRKIERRVNTVIRRQSEGESEQVVPDAPVGTPEAFEEHLHLMYDLLAMAYQSEITRVATLMYAKDLSPTSFPESGNRGGFHGASHHANIPERMDSFAVINQYHVAMLAYFIDKLATTPDRDGSLLDHSMILYGSSMSNGNQHDHSPLPIVLLGGASGQLEGNRHIVTPENTPMANLLLGMLDKLGGDEEFLGDSTGKLSI